MVIEQSRPTAQVAREIDVQEGTLDRWVTLYWEEHAGEEPPLSISERTQLRELKKEVAELRNIDKLQVRVHRWREGELPHHAHVCVDWRLQVRLPPLEEQARLGYRGTSSGTEGTHRGYFRRLAGNLRLSTCPRRTGPTGRDLRTRARSAPHASPRPASMSAQAMANHHDQRPRRRPCRRSRAARLHRRRTRRETCRGYHLHQDLGRILLFIDRYRLPHQSRHRMADRRSHANSSPGSPAPRRCRSGRASARLRASRPGCTRTPSETHFSGSADSQFWYLFVDPATASEYLADSCFHLPW